MSIQIGDKYHILQRLNKMELLLIQILFKTNQ